MPSRRILVIPAAGRGSRLGVEGPKVLAPVAGRPMLDWLLALYAGRVDVVALVVQARDREAVEVVARRRAGHVITAVQDAPTGMLDAVRIGIGSVAGELASRIWVTWCDQIAVRPQTLDRLTHAEEGTALTFPVVTQSPPYIHFERDDGGRIVRVRQRREGDVMPDTGESDMGVFSLSPDAAGPFLHQFDSEASAGPGTGERNFLPFIPWLAARADVRTFPATDPFEAVGINTPDDRARVEAYLLPR
jgi:bifunctional N-acetylglucosamine-1-phosphate-uridyltransferase/glucosamine-1-phosphate-acetyltransferase GlmU-like protein